MTSLRSFLNRLVSSEQANPRRLLGRRPVILAALAVILFTQTGCQSNFLSPCSGCGGGFPRLRNLRERVLPRPVTTGCCGNELGVEAAPLVYGNPGVITTAPSGSIGTVSPSQTPPETGTSTLDPLPQAAPGPPPTTLDSGVKAGVKGLAGKAVYEARRPRYDQQGVGSTLARSLTSSPEPTPRSAQGLSSSASAPANANETNPLDNRPPLDLPREVTQAKATSIPDDPTESKPKAVTGPAPELSPAPAVDTLGGTNTSPDLPAPVTAEMTVSPGIRHFAGVDSKLAGGSLPNASGLDWLVEMGYKTLLDLREPNEVDASFIPEVTKRGLTYHSLPITLKTIDAEHLAKFQTELADATARPLYFCDTDGNRAGLLWYIKRITADKVNSDVAEGDAADLGLLSPEWRKAAKEYVGKIKTASS